MAETSNEVYVLGAGFTKAFAADAPLLLGDYETEEVCRFNHFHQTSQILDWERRRCPPGKLNLERLMTRLAGGMPYDWPLGQQDLLRALLSALTRSLLQKLHQAKAADNVLWADLKAFATHCRRNGIRCITFNYDDFLDQALWETTKDQWDGSDLANSWHPAWGYGFFCESAVRAIGAAKDIEVDPPSVSMELLKLHGSVNWRIRHGHPAPYATDAITHFEDWWTVLQFQHASEADSKDLSGLVQQYLEPHPFIVPPVLTKSELVEQPILRVIWSLACDFLIAAEKVTFVGYSFPMTDIAASTLFRETLGHLKPKQVTVVNHPDPSKANEGVDDLLRSYREVFPDLGPDQINLCGGLEWARHVSASG